MGNFCYIIPYNHVNGTIADANEVNANNSADRDAHNAAFNAITGHGHTGLTCDGPKITADGLDLSAVSQLPPVGIVIPIYDFNGLVTFNASYWKYCDGTAIVEPMSPINGQIVPDLSNRYIVGFGTEGGGDIGTDAWATPPVGIPNHTAAGLAHFHTINGHSHIVNAHNHTISASGNHLHGTIGGDGLARTGGMSTHATQSITSYEAFYEGGGGSWGSSSSGGGIPYSLENGNSPGNSSHHDHVVNLGGDHDHSGVTGGTSPNTDLVNLVTNSSLSAAQSVQPRSIRMRYIMRIQ